MCIGRTPTPQAQPIQQPPTLQDPNVANAGTEAQRRARAAAGAASTDTATDTAASAPILGRTLLGQ